MARKQAVGYTVRRPLTLWGKKREIGDYLTAEEVSSLVRIESLVRSGRVKAVFKETDRGYVHRGTHGRTVKSQDEPSFKSNAVASDEPVVEEKPKRRRKAKESE